MIKKHQFEKVYLILTTIIIILVFSCSEDKSIVDPIDTGTVLAKIAVFSDPHFFDPSLGISDSTSSEFIGYNRKMTAASEAILTSAIKEILDENVNILLIPGDLTKDGELQSHQMFAEHLKQVEDSGVKVFVVPGNHDINNPNAKSYNGTEPTPVENISPSKFAEIYAKFGYNEALYRDPNSLSYIVQPLDNVWIIGIDDCDYDNNIANGYSETSGRLKTETYEWIKTKISEGAAANKLVFGIMHHGITEHFIKQNEFFSPYIVKDYIKIRSEFALLGMKAIFTGHFHAQDIVKHQEGSKFIFDIETGSLVTWPSPFRIIELTSNSFLNIFSERITSIDFNTNGLTFQEYAKNSIEEGLPEMITSILIKDFSLTNEEAMLVAPLMIEAIMAHYDGDENPSQETQNALQQLTEHQNPTIQQIAMGLNFLWLDIPPQDNALKINLNNGTVN
ncbi:MAG: metallophosphoesterase [Bacteroidota bacterium]